MCTQASRRAQRAYRQRRKDIATISYESLWMYSNRFATPEQKKKKREIVKAFISNAKVGDVYEIGGGTGGTSSTFEIVSYNRSPNKLGIKSGNYNTIQLSSTNVEKWLNTGAKLIKRKK